MGQQALRYKSLIELGCIDYSEARDIQRLVHQDIAESGYRGALIECEHPPILTLGRMSKRHHILASEDILKRRSVEIIHVDRGGDVTLHAPGQIVLYPILNLSFYRKDLHWYLHSLEEVIIDFLRDFGILARRFPGQTGVWVNDKKIASIGIGVKKWITYHGLAVNVNTDLELFRLIKPCGLDVDMTSMAKILENDIAWDQARYGLIKSFEKTFQINAI